MENLENLYAKLEEYSNFEIEENCEKFLDTADLIILQKDPASMKILLSYFDDDTDYTWVFESIRCSLQHYPMKLYIENILKCLELIFPRAGEWIKYLVYPILNDSVYLEYFKNNLDLGNKEFLNYLFDKIYDESLEHRAIILDLKKLLKMKNS